jgi:hypothetical protein
MKIAYEQRASTILFNLLKSLDHSGIFLIPANVCPIVPVTFFKAKQQFELIDISADTMCMNERVLLQKLKDNPQRYSGFLYVHTYGVQDSFEPLFQVVKQIAPHALLIDDRCLCIPNFNAEVQTAADAVLYSTGYSKYVEMDFGGYGFIKPEVRYASLRLAYNPDDHQALVAAMKEAQESKQPFSYKDTDWLDSTAPTVSYSQYQAKVAARTLAVQTHKKQLNHIYSRNIPKEAQLGQKFHNWRFNILVPQKEKLLKAIFNHGLFASSHFPSLQGVFGQGSDHQAANLHTKVVNLFNNDRFTHQQAEQTAVIVAKHIKLYGSA